MVKKSKGYVLTIDAKHDLSEIAEYTLKNWSLEIFEAYREGLKATFNAIANHSVIKKPFSKNLADVFVTKYRYHFIFYVQNKEQTIIIGVIHEQRELVYHLTHRLI